MKAWRVVQHGSPSEALRLDEVDVAEPGPGELRVRTSATVGNYNEVDGCRGRYLTVNPPLPYTLGMEVVGVVEAAGPGPAPDRRGPTIGPGSLAASPPTIGAGAAGLSRSASGRADRSAPGVGRRRGGRLCCGRPRAPG